MDDNKVHLGDGVLDEVKLSANNGMKDLANILIEVIIDYLKEKVKNLPENVEHLLKSQKAKQEVIALWSEQLLEEGLVPSGYNGLPNRFLVANLHQDGYLDGLYVGYALAMMALVDNNATKELILSVRDCIRPNLHGHRYDKRDEFLNKYKDEKYSWINVSD